MTESDNIYDIFSEAVKKSKDIKWNQNKIGWFHWGVDKSIEDFEFTPEIVKNITEITNEAMDYLGKLGVSKQHNYIVIKDLKDYNTGDTAAYASGKIIAIDQKYIKDKTDFSTEVIIHEWAHRYFFNLTKKEKETFKDVYENFVNPTLDDHNKLNIALDKFERDITSGPEKRNESYIDYILNEYPISSTIEQAIYNYYNEFEKKYELALYINKLSQSGMDNNEIINQLFYNLTFEYNKERSDLFKTFKSFGIFNKETGEPINILKDDIEEIILDMSQEDKDEYIDMYSHINEDDIESIMSIEQLVDDIVKSYDIIFNEDESFVSYITWNADIEEHFEIFNKIPYNKIPNKMVIYDKQKYFNAVSTHPMIKIVSIILGDTKLVDNNKQFVGDEYSTLRLHRRLTNKLPSDYSATNLDELWAESITKFFTLENKELKKVIVNILSYSSR